MPKVNEVRVGVPANLSFQESNGHVELALARLAINLFDLTKIDLFVRQMLGLAAKLDAKAGPIRVDRDRPDETAVAFHCLTATDLLMAAALCDVIRNNDRKVGDVPTRTYLKRQVWSRLPGFAVLTLVDADGTLRLNPEWFPESTPAVELEAPSVNSIFGG